MKNKDRIETLSNISGLPVHRYEQAGVQYFVFGETSRPVKTVPNYAKAKLFAEGVAFGQGKVSTQEEISALYDLLYERVVDVCRAAVEKICKANGWNFSSAFATMFTTKVPHEYQPDVLVNREHDWPDEFQQVFDWAEQVASFPDMIYEDGKWVA